MDHSNAFGSISHKMIVDMLLKHVSVPTPIISYTRNAYSQLKGFISSATDLATDPHRAKSYCDDLSLIPANQEEHKSTLSQIDTHRQSLDFHLKASKCTYLAFNSKRIIPMSPFPSPRGAPPTSMTSQLSSLERP